MDFQTSMLINKLSEMIVNNLRADTGVCPYDSYLSLKPRKVGVTPRGDPFP